MAKFWLQFPSCCSSFHALSFSVEDPALLFNFDGHFMLSRWGPVRPGLCARVLCSDPIFFLLVDQGDVSHVNSLWVSSLCPNSGTYHATNFCMLYATLCCTLRCNSLAFSLLFALSGLIVSYSRYVETIDI